LKLKLFIKRSLRVEMSGMGQALKGRLALVTGGSNGIGAAAVKRLAGEGADVIIGYHSSPERAEALRQSLPAGQHRIARLSLEEPASFATLANDVARDFGKLDILVNSAGFTRAIAHHDLETLDDALFEKILVANVRGPWSAIRAFAALLKASNDGLIINVSSISGFTGSGSNVAYCASKAALDSITMSLGRVLGPDIRIMSVSPGAVATDFVPGRDRAALEKGAQSTPIKRVVEPEDVADAILACATLLKVSTGCRIITDGGRHLV
jgi:3-oxoacyl-[acyl-carrier protein] reductase